MATPAFTGVDYLSALSEFPGGPQGLIDAAVERFGDQGLTATPRGDDFSLYVPGEFMSSGRPMNYASTLANPTVGGGYYDYLYSTPAFKDIYTNILAPTLTGLQQAPQQTLEQTGYASRPNYGATRPIAKAGPAVDPIIGETEQPPPATVPLEPSPRIAEATQPSIPTERQTLESALTATPTTPTQAATPLPVVDRVAEPTPPQAQPTPIDTRTQGEKDIDEYFDLVNRVKYGGEEVLKRSLTRDPVATTAITREVAAERPPTQGLVLDMPLTSRYPDSTGQQYLRGGLDAFAYSGPQGYADVRQRLLGEPADVFTGPEVDWQRLAQPAPSDIYLETGFPDISVDDILANIPKVDPKLAPPTPKAFADTTAELVEIDRDNLFDRVIEDYGELELERKEDLKNRINSFMPEAGDLSPYPADLRSGEAEDFKFYEHPKTKAVVGNIIGNIKNAITKAGDGVEVAVNHLKGLTDELTRFVERNGGRSSVEQQAWGPTLLGVTDILTGDLKGFDKQTQGDIQWAAVAIAIAEYGTPIGNAIGAMQLANTIKDWGKSTVNVSTFDSPLYESGNEASFDAAYRDSIEFVGDVLRPMAKTISKYTLDKLAKDVPADASVRQKLQAVFGREVGEMEGPKQFVITDQEPVQGPQQDPTGQITPEVPDVGRPSAPTPALNIERPTTQTPITSRTLTPIEIEFETAQQPTAVGRTQPVVGAPQTVVESRAPISLDDIATLPLTEVPFDRGDVLDLSQPRIDPLQSTDAFGRVIPTLDELTFVPDTATRPSPFTGMSVSAGALDRPMSTLPGVELIPVDSDRIPIADNIQIDVPRVPRYGATEGITPFTEVAPRPSLEPVTREPEDAVNASLPVDANGQVTTNLKDIVGFRNFSTNVESLTEMFGERGAIAIAAGETMGDDWDKSGQYGNPLPKLREQWNIQQTQNLEDELKTKAIDSFVDSTGSPEGFKQAFPDYQNTVKRTIDRNHEYYKERFGDDFPLSASLYITLRNNPSLGGSAKQQAFKDNFTEALKTFAQDKTILSELDKPLNLDNIEESVNIDNSAILDRMGIRIEGLTNVGTDFSGERPDVYKEPAREIFEEQFTSDKLNELMRLDDIALQTLRNMGEDQRKELLDYYRSQNFDVSEFEDFPEAEIDAASAEFDLPDWLTIDMIADEFIGPPEGPGD